MIVSIKDVAKDTLLAQLEEILQRTAAVVARAKRVRGCSWLCARECVDIHRRLDDIERELAADIDDYMARRLHRYIYVDGPRARR